MKNIFTSLVLATGAMVAGCSTYRGDTVLAPVGPGPTATVAANANDGSLLVYSAYSDTPEFNGRDVYRPHYTDYRVLSADGQMIKWVHNDSGTATQSPEPVKLPAGNYKVVARANGYGQVTVPVIIAAQRRTVVHLEGDISQAK
jgi:hypothetical protein